MLPAIFQFVTAHWLSVLLIAGAIAATAFVFKHKEKFAKNTFE